MFEILVPYRLLMGPWLGICVSTMYTTEFVAAVAGVYERWTHVQLAFQRKKGHLPKILQNKHVTKERGNKWKQGGLQVPKVDTVGGT